MNNIIKDKEYYNIVKDILENDNFNRIKECKHHGGTRLDHSINVSYKTYLKAKKYKLDYVSVARAGLLHDFFITDELTKKERKKRLIIHPYKALENANKYFELNKLEENIIVSHMFPSLPQKLPKYKESLLVSITDKIVATKELYHSYGRTTFNKLANLYIILITLLK